MILIHQRKSAGTSLMYTLSKVLGVEIDTNRSLAYRNTRGERLFNYLLDRIDSTAPIVSIHLHPTEMNYNWIVDNKIKCVILLRNPHSSYEALYRHLEEDNSRVGPNGKIYFKDVKNWFIEFYNNWSNLKTLNHVHVIYYEQLISNPSEVIEGILSFYGASEFKGKIELDQKRYTTGNKTIRTVQDLPEIKPPTFLYDPDYISPFRRMIYLPAKIFVRRFVPENARSYFRQKRLQKIMKKDKGE